MTTTTSHLPTRDASIEMTVRSTGTRVQGARSSISTYDDTDNEQFGSRPLPRDSDEDDDDNEGDGLLVRDVYDAPTPKKWPLWRKGGSSKSMLMTIGLVLSSIAVVAGLLLHTLAIRGDRQSTEPHWRGFAHVENYFAFGDSWTTTRFDVNGEQPSTRNPLGNPAFPGETSSAGHNYVGYLTAQYNHSFIKAYDFAYGGSVIDAGIDHPALDWLDFAHQLKDEFVKYYTNNDTGTPIPLGWTSENSLFSIFFGINDVMIFNKTAPPLDLLFRTYELLIDRLYDASARNFLLLNVPPLDKAPAVTENRALTPSEFVTDIAAVNNLMAELAKHVRTKYKDITIFEYDVHDLFERVIENPQAIPQTASYKEMYAFCQEYKFGFFHGEIPTAAEIEKCGGLNIDEYLWKDELHVTWPVHDAIAAGIESVLTQASMS